VNNKYSKPFWVDKFGRRYDRSCDIPTTEAGAEYWHSELEFNCYLCIKKQLKPGQLLQRQYPIAILPSSAQYKTLHWKVDFYVATSASYYGIPIEVKGAWLLTDKGELASFQKTLKMLASYAPEYYQKLRIVSNKRFRIDERQTTQLITDLKL